MSAEPPAAARTKPKASAGRRPRCDGRMPTAPPEPPFRVALLGPPLLEFAGRSQPLAAQRRFQLLAFLGHQADWVSRDRLAGLFWPEQAAAAARSNLRKVLYRLRELPDAPLLEERAGALRWRVASDVQAFETALAAGRLLEALTCWRGEPWAGLDVNAPAGLADWLSFERLRLRARWRGALLQLAHETPDAVQAAGLAQQLIAHDPLDEEAVQACLRAQLRAGLAAGAHRCYQQFARALADGLGLAPSVATRALLDSPGVADAPTASAPAAPTSDGSTSFIGRDAELHELKDRLAEPACRWLTITGPGGIGKSRLLAQTLAMLAPDALWVPLEDLADSSQLGARLCERLGLPGSGEPMDLVRAALQSRRFVLGLDNLEHLQSAVPALDALLSACPRLQLLVSSRARCGAASEWLLPLLGLPYPAAADADRAEAFDAVRLFVQRAREARPRFTLDAERAAVVELCEFTEGLPLAIELAAAWSRHLPVHELVRDLRDGQLLDEAVPGQRSVAATFEYSWQRMVPAERLALAALSVFRGGFTRGAARQVAGASLGVLTALLDKSLLRHDDAGPARSASRFSLHPLLQQFVHAKLALDADALTQAQRRHAEFFGQLLLRLPAPDQAAAMTAFCREQQPELDNLAAAWLWALAQRRVDLLRDAATPLRVVHYVNARWREGLALLDAATGAVVGDAVALARVNVSRLVLLYNLGRCAEAVALAQQLLPALRRGAEPRMLTTALLYAGQAELVLGHTEAARGHFEKALAVARRLLDRLGMSSGLGGLAIIHHLAGRYSAACAAMEECVAVRSAIGGDLAQALNNLGLMQLSNGQPQLAIATFERGLQRCDAEGNPSARTHLHYNQASAQLQLGDLAQAERLATHCAEHGVDSLAPVLAIQLGLLRARIAGQRGDLPQARRWLLQATAEARQLQGEPALLSAAAHWAEWLGQSGEPARAATLLAVVLARPELEHAERLFAQQVLDAVRARHSAAEHDQALATGARLSLQRALDLLPT